MPQTLKTFPFYIFLLPVSFVLHGYIQHFGFISALDAGLLALTYCAFSGSVFLLSWIVFKNIKKAALITASWVGIYLYFGALLDFLRVNSPFSFVYRYRYLMPFIVLCIVLIFIYLKKTNSQLTRVTLFLNILFLIYISYDTIDAVWKSTHQLDNKLAIYDFAKSSKGRIPDTCNRPDIYLLLFDEYASSKSLLERYQFRNDIDSFYESLNFSVQRKSTSNYNYTPFSMASTLNMSYLNWIRPEIGVDRHDFLECNPAILKNELIKFLGTNGYDIVNLSVFDLAGHPSKLKQSFLPIKTKMIAEGTMFPRLYNDFEWVFINSVFLSKLMGQDYFFQHIGNNDLLFSDVVKESEHQHDRPRFIYTHFYMPHEPFFFDEHGKRKDNRTVIAEYKARSPSAYLQYVQYTNTRMKLLINTLMKNTGGKATIVVLGDHGFRKYTNESHPVWHFQNLNAVYFPDKNYRLLYDSISNVNEFRVVLNTLFNQQLPMLHDSTVYLIDRDFMVPPKVQLPATDRGPKN